MCLGSGSVDLIPGLLVWQRIQFIAKQILLVNSSSSSSLWLKRCTKAQAETYFIYLKLGANFVATFDITLCHGGPSYYFASSPRSQVQIFIPHHIHHHNKQSWISVSTAWLKAQAKYYNSVEFIAKWIDFEDL